MNGAPSAPLARRHCPPTMSADTAGAMSYYLRPLEVQEKLAVAFAPVDRRVGQAMHL